MSQQRPDHGVVPLARTNPGYPQPVNIFVPPDYQQDPSRASLNLHLHGHLIAGTVENSVFNKNDFGALLSASRSRSALVVPESQGQDTTYSSQWVFNKQGPANFNRFMTNVASTMGYTAIASGTLTTHSGSGYIGDHVVNDTEFGRAVRFRGHFDDGQTSSTRGRWVADEAVLKRGGSVFAVANAGGVSAYAMDVVAATHQSGRDPMVVVRNKRGKVIGTQFQPSPGAAPRANITDIERAAPRRLTELNVMWGRENPDSPHFASCACYPRFGA